MNTKPFEELLQAYLDGTLGEAEWQALAQDLATSEPHRAELARHVVLDAMLQQVGEPALDRETILRALPDSKATKLSLRVAEVRGKVSGFRCQGSGGPESGVLSPTGLQNGDIPVSGQIRTRGLVSFCLLF